MNVVEIINEAIASGRTRFAFELLPPLKGDGMQKIFAAVEPLMDFDPAYVNITFHREGIKETEREDGEYTSFDSTNASLHPGDLIWITGKLTGVSNLLATAPGTTVDQCVYSAYLPGINPYTGQIMYLHYRDLIPVRG